MSPSGLASGLGTVTRGGKVSEECRDNTDRLPGRRELMQLNHEGPSRAGGQLSG